MGVSFAQWPNPTARCMCVSSAGGAGFCTDADTAASAIRDTVRSEIMLLPEGPDLVPDLYRSYAVYSRKQSETEL
jgi:hypothetical protein